MGMGALAAVLRFQPSEIDALDLEDFLHWLDQVRRVHGETEAASAGARGR